MNQHANTHNTSSSSEVYSGDLRINKYSFLTHVYFFFNSVFLPKGLLYTLVLSPLFFFNTLKRGRRTWIAQFLIFLIIFDCVHLYNGVDLTSFVVSNGLFICTYFFVVSAFHFVSDYRFIGKLFRQVLLFNALLVVIAIPFFFAPREYQEWFWYFNKLTRGIKDFPRLALFTYEASYYSLLLLPVFYYYVFKFLFRQVQSDRWLTLAMAVVPMLLSLSFGVLGGTFITAIVMCIIFSRKLIVYKTAFYTGLSVVIVLILSVVLLYIFYPANPLFIRIANIVSGTDTSAAGRTTDSFSMSWMIAESRSIVFGTGLGQIKIMSQEVVRKYFSYWGDYARYDIPNTIGETLAIFGVLGLSLRLGLQCWLFFKTKVYSNYYRLSLFIFVFIYQFTGSFITNIVEYVIWILAFSPVFTQFDVSPSKTDQSAHSQAVR